MQNLRVNHRYLSASPHLLFLVESATDFARRRCYFVAEKPVDGTVYLQDRGEGNGIGQQTTFKTRFLHCPVDRVSTMCQFGLPCHLSCTQ